MANKRKWSNVAVALESARAAAVVISGITKATPGVVSTAGTLPANGAYVLFDVVGMSKINNAVFRVSGAAAGSFRLADVATGAEIDTSTYDAFTSGSFYVVTMGTSITTATTINPSGGEFDQIDTTTVHDSQRSTIPGLPSAMSYNMDHIWDPADVGLKALNAAYKSNAKKVVMFTFGLGGPKMIFAGYVGAHLMPGGSSQGLVTTSTVFTIDGFPTYYAE